MPENHSIRFINSNYKELFRIPDGGKIRVDFPDRSFISPCSYIDDYHTVIGGNVYHICEFAEMLERGNGKASPEPEMFAKQAAWQILHREYLTVHATDDGWDYSVYDKEFGMVDGGRIDLPDITIQECRDMILKDLGWQRRNFTEVDFDMVEDRAVEAAAKNMDSVLGRLREKHRASSDDCRIYKHMPGKEKSEKYL